jgi:hypothetical protein
VPTVVASDKSSLKTEISQSLNGTVLVSKVTLGGRAIATGYQTDWPVITIVNTETGEIAYRVESGMVRFDVGPREMRQRYESGSQFHLSSYEMKDDRLELKLESGSGGSAKLKLLLGQNWQSRLTAAQVMTQLARVFDLPKAQNSSPNTASSTEGNTVQTTRRETKVISQAGTSSNATQPQGSSDTVQPLAVYVRASSAPKLPGRMSPEEVQAIIAEISKEGNHETNSFLSEAGSTVSADLLEIYNATMREPNSSRHPIMKGITALRQRLGNSLQPKNVRDVEAITHILDILAPHSAREHEHVEAEKRAVNQYKTQQAPFISAASTIANIEQALDQNRLMDADSLCQSMLTDSFMSGFAPTQRYLAETAVLRGELSALREANQLPRVFESQQLSEQVNVLANEVANAQAKSDKLLASEVLKKNVEEDKPSVQSRLASLSAFEFDSTMYKILPINNEKSARDATVQLDELNGKLDSSRDLINLLASPDAVANVRLLFGDALEAQLRQKGRTIPLAQETKVNLSSAIVTYKQRVADADARRQAEVEAARQKEAERKGRAELLAEERSIANMPTHWPKAECIRAANNFATNQDILTSADNYRASELIFASRGLSSCDQYAWTYSERNQPSLPAPFKAIADGEQKFLVQCLNVKYVNYIRRHNLQQKFASELVHYDYDAVLNNTVQLTDTLAFLERHALMKDFYIEDDSQFDKLDISERVKSLHAAELLLGLAQ